jgi:hypothetical protein
MKRLTCILLLAALAATLLSAPASAADWRSFRPASHGGTTKISVGGKELTYYRFSESEPLTFSVDGPTRVKILTRVRVPNDVESVAYDLTVTRDGVQVETVGKEAYPKEGAFYVAFNHFRPGVIRRVYIDVPTGRHGYELAVSGREVVDARLFESAESKPSLVSIAPSEFSEVETLLYREKELTYYLMTCMSPVVLDVVGPTTVKVNTRLLYGATMMGDQTYVVAVGEADEPECLYRIDAEPSHTVLCRDRDDGIPGALRHFALEVPAGAHTYTFRLADKTAEGVAVKFYIPKGDLSNEP